MFASPAINDVFETGRSLQDKSRMIQRFSVRDGCARRRAARAVACTSRTFLRKTMALDLTLMLNFLFRCTRIRAWIRWVRINDESRKFVFFLLLFFYVRQFEKRSRQYVGGQRNRIPTPVAVRGDFCGPAVGGTRETWPQEQVSDPRTTFRLVLDGWVESYGCIVRSSDAFETSLARKWNSSWLGDQRCALSRWNLHTYLLDQPAKRSLLRIC